MFLGRLSIHRLRRNVAKNRAFVQLAARQQKSHAKESDESNRTSHQQADGHIGPCARSDKDSRRCGLKRPFCARERFESIRYLFGMDSGQRHEPQLRLRAPFGVVIFLKSGNPNDGAGEGRNTDSPDRDNPTAA